MCLSLPLVKPKPLIKSCFSSHKFCKAELAEVIFQRQYAANLTRRLLGSVLQKLKNKHQTHTHTHTKSLMKWQKQQEKCWCGNMGRFWRFLHVKHYPLAFIFKILFATNFLTLNFKNKDVQKLPQIREIATTDFTSFKGKPQVPYLHFKPYPKQLDFLKFYQLILIICFSLFCWEQNMKNLVQPHQTDFLTLYWVLVTHFSCRIDQIS